MPVEFNNIPGDVLVPFFYAEVNSAGTPYAGRSVLLLVGQKLTGGTATVDVPVGPVASLEEVRKLAGVGSMLASMYEIARRNAPFKQIWLLPLADPAGAKATATITITAPAKDGVGVLRLLGRRIAIQILAAEAAADIAAHVVAEIGKLDLPVTAAVGGVGSEHIVTVTARHNGVLGNGMELKRAHLEEHLFTSVNCVLTAFTGGSGTPALSTGFANLGEDEYDWIASPYADATSLNAADALLNDISGRWSFAKQLYGHYITGAYDTLANLVTLGNSRNDQHVSILGMRSLPTPVWEFVAAAAGRISVQGTNAPALSRPLQNLVLLDVLPPDDRTLWWDQDDRQALYTDGIGACRVNAVGRVQLDRVVTTYQLSDTGVVDSTFRDIETMAQLTYVVRYFRTEVSRAHGRSILNRDTLRAIENTLVHAYRDLVRRSVLEDVEGFERRVRVERNAEDANRVDAYLPLDMVNQLRVFAANVTAFLER